MFAFFNQQVFSYQETPNMVFWQSLLSRQQQWLVTHSSKNKFNGCLPIIDKQDTFTPKHSDILVGLPRGNKGETNHHFVIFWARFTCSTEKSLFNDQQGSKPPLRMFLFQLYCHKDPSSKPTTTAQSTRASSLILVWPPFFRHCPPFILYPPDEKPVVG